MSRSFPKHFDSLERQSIHFANSHAPTGRHEKSLDKAFKLFHENTASRPAATKSRQGAARNILTSIGRDPSLGLEVFFLCILAISISDLSSVALKDEFIKQLQRWWKEVSHPDLQGLLTKLEPKWNKVVDELGIGWPNPSTSSSATWLHDMTTQPSLHNPSDANFAEALPQLSAQDQETEQPQDEGHCPPDDMEADQDDASEGAAANAVQPVFQFQRVYKLKPMDAIRVLSTMRASDCHLRLTMPLSSGATPFITFHCPQKLVWEIGLELSVDTDLTMEPTASHGQYQPN